MAANTPKHPVESVWDYPRPPAIEPVKFRIQIVFNGETIVDTTDAYRILETSHPPTYYIPRKDIKMQYMIPNSRSTYCEWKGAAGYFDIKVGDKLERAAAWYYSSPTPKYAAIKDNISFYPSRMDECYVDGERAFPQESDFYGGWVNSWISGGTRGMKGPPGTWGW